MSRLVTALTLLVLALSVTGCKRNEYKEPPPPPVVVSQPVQKAVTQFMEFTGMTQASESVNLTARVEGYLQSINFEPGALVKAGDLLFVIDPRPFQAALDQAKSQLATAVANNDAMQAQYVRKSSALKSNAVSEYDVIQAKAQADAAVAAIDGAKAQIETAQLNLEWTQVTTPIDGKVSRNLVDIGNLVGAGQATLLTTVVKNQPMYVYFNIGEQQLLELKAKVQAEGKITPQGPKNVDVFVGLANEQGFPHKGTIDFADNQLDKATGTLQLRGVFENADNALISGLFARVQIPTGVEPNALLIPERAILSDQGGFYVMVVRSDNVVEQRPITKDISVDGMAVITKGLTLDDVVIVNGVQRARAGGKVSPQKAAAAAK